MLKDTILTLNSITNEVPPELFSMFTEVFLNHKLNLIVPPGLLFMVTCSAKSSVLYAGSCVFEFSSAGTFIYWLPKFSCIIR